MGLVQTVPNKAELPVQAGTLAEGMSSLHKAWEALPFNVVLPGFTMGYATN